MEPSLNKGINILPEEILVVIFSYLELEDVLSCSLVSKSWKNALNMNGIWFNLCSQRSPVRRNNLELLQAPSLVDPAFTSPIQTSLSLPEACPWRLRFMQGTHLSRNWRLGRFVAYPFGRTFWFECGDENVIFVREYGEEFSCYSINSRPRLLQTTRIPLRRVYIHFFKLAGGKLAVGQSNLIQVFSQSPSNDEMFELSHRFLYDRNESESNNIPNSPDITEWYHCNVGLHSSYSDYHCDHNGDYFVGLVLEDEGNLNEAVFHIWDLNTRHKTVHILVPDIKYPVVRIKISIHSSNVYILMAVTDRPQQWTVIRCLSLNTFKYTGLDIQFTSNVKLFLVRDKLLFNVELYGEDLWIRSEESGSLIDKLSCDFVIDVVEFVLDLVIIAGNTYDLTGIVKVFNISSLKCICEFETDYRIKNLFFISSGLVLVCGLRQTEIWDIATETKLQELQYRCLWISPAKTKVLVEKGGEFQLLHFW